MKFALASLAAIASANMPHMYEAEATNGSDVVISQVSGFENFIMLENDTYADPNPVKTAITEKFNVGGIWNVPNVDLDNVVFECKLAGVVAYHQAYDCTSAGDSNDYGQCPKPSGEIGEEWLASFGFDVPGFAPPFVYSVTVTGYSAAGVSVFQLASDFTI